MKICYMEVLFRPAHTHIIPHMEPRPVPGTHYLVVAFALSLRRSITDLFHLKHSRETPRRQAYLLPSLSSYAQKFENLSAAAHVENHVR